MPLPGFRRLLIKTDFFYSFKQHLNFESYLIRGGTKQYLHLIKLRASNHRLTVEIGRWENVAFDERK